LCGSDGAPAVIPTAACSTALGSKRKPGILTLSSILRRGWKSIIQAQANAAKHVEQEKRKAQISDWQMATSNFPA
jgi:hypothetical protein